MMWVKEGWSRSVWFSGGRDREGREDATGSLLQNCHDIGGLHFVGRGGRLRSAVILFSCWDWSSGSQRRLARSGAVKRIESHKGSLERSSM